MGGDDLEAPGRVCRILKSPAEHRTLEITEGMYEEGVRGCSPDQETIVSWGGGVECMFAWKG